MVEKFDHRIKNLFALVIGPVNLSVRESPQLSPLVDMLRLGALRHAHQYMRMSGTNSPTVASGTQGTDHSRPLPLCRRDGNPAAEIDGNDASIDAAETTSFALLINQLATNSVKYGAWPRRMAG